MNLSALTALSRQTGSGDAYLRFQIAPHTPAVIPMRYVQEVLMLPIRRLTMMPNMPAAMLGLMNWRSQILWTVDLAQLMGLPMLDSMLQQYILVLIQVGSIPLALAVREVEGTTRLQAGSIQSLDEQLPQALQPYLRGGVVSRQGASKPDLLLVLDVEAILKSPILHRV
jgi:positive phototaxis protein PixI